MSLEKIIKLADKTLPDEMCPIKNTKVVQNYSCSLYCINGADKFYILQVLNDNGVYYVYKRYGSNKKIGGNIECKPCGKGEEGYKKSIVEFKKVFKNKVRENWEDVKNGTVKLEDKYYTYTFVNSDFLNFKPLISARIENKVRCQLL